VLTHLILNDMMKVKGHIARMAACLEDPDPRVAALAQLFFHELSKKEYKGTSPIYNLLPDILSNLSADGALGRGQFQAVMQQLLAYIKKDKQVGGVCARVGRGGGCGAGGRRAGGRAGSHAMLPFGVSAFSGRGVA
jgi:condensin complex subunit 1